MDLLVAALAGGAIGAALAALARVPFQVRHNNRTVEEHDAELATWVTDEAIRLEREMKRTTRRYAESGKQGQPGHARALAQVREESLRAYRDSEIAAQNRRAVLRDGEGWQHDVWRWVTATGQLPELRVPRKAKPVIDAWREPVSFGEVSARVSDPTARDLDAILNDLATRKAGEDEPPPPLPGREGSERRGGAESPERATAAQRARQQG